MVDLERALGARQSTAPSSPPIDARLIGQIAHELRTPLASLRVAFELMSDEDAVKALEANPKQKNRLIVNMGRSLEKIEQQVTDLLDIGYLQANRLSLKLESIKPAELIAGACESTSVLAERRSQFIAIKIDDGVSDIDGDRDRLEQVLVNLLSYLMRVTPVGATLTVEASSESGELEFAIKGGGRPAPFEERERLFEPFFRLRDEGGQVQDSGLGLAIARALINLHGGRVWFESPVRGGNTFRVSLPIRQQGDESFSS